MKRYQLIALVLASATVLQGTLVSAAVQDDDNLDACCLASEYRLQEAAPNRAPAKTTKTACQVPLGNVSCCVGAEWKLESVAAPVLAPSINPPEVVKSQPQSDDSFCCIASEWSSR